VDLSKLPRLSNSQQPPIPTPNPDETIAQTVPSANPQRVPMDYAPPQSAAFRGEAWIAFAIGIILLLMFPRFLQWGSSRIFHTHFNEYVMADGVTIVPYPQMHDIWPDVGCTLFGLTLVLEGLALGLPKNRLILWIAFVFTILATAYNLIYLITSFNQYGLALVSALAVVFGVYITGSHWRYLQAKQ
jgi:hypothetical protein